MEKENGKEIRKKVRYTSIKKEKEKGLRCELNRRKGGKIGKKEFGIN